MNDPEPEPSRGDDTLVVTVCDSQQQVLPRGSCDAEDDDDDEDDEDDEDDKDDDDLRRRHTCVAPLSSGPYATYEWPVIQPQSAVQNHTSPRSRECTSNTYLTHTHETTKDDERRRMTTNDDE